ncbi:MAG: hypothetical protein OEX97_07425 [Acidimicrobiia bacterium]|nr:hypothetical protein [Acidimicrobiia bacterium]
MTGIVAAIAAVTGLVIGAAAVKWYAWDIVIGQADEPDRSMLFWGLPILFIGLIALATGGALVVVARRRIRKPAPDGD